MREIIEVLGVKIEIGTTDPEVHSQFSEHPRVWQVMASAIRDQVFGAQIQLNHVTNRTPSRQANEPS